MGFRPVRGDNQRALASVLFYVQVEDKHGITILYHLHEYRPYTSRDISSKVGKGGIKEINPSFVLVQSRETRPYIIERLLMEHKESNKTNKTYFKSLV